MCCRIAQHYTWAEIAAFLNISGVSQDLKPRCNIAPTTWIDVMRQDAAGQRELIRVRWGLIPSWWRQPLEELPTSFNARTESIVEHPAFGDAVLRRRCIIPASGFYDWTYKAGAKQPFFFTAADGSPGLALAGLWENWRHMETNEEILSCTIIVSPASAWMEAYNSRMPVLLKPDQVERWLSGDMNVDELRPAAQNALKQRQVSARLNHEDVGTDPTISLPV
jgi:putative SOS response-associated peptidase YedK